MKNNGMLLLNELQFNILMVSRDLATKISTIKL